MVRAAAAVVVCLLVATPALARTVFVSLDDRARMEGPLRSQVQKAVLEAAAKDGTKNGARVRDISELSRALFAPGMLVPAFDRPPPADWPKALTSDWEEGNAGCRDRVARFSPLAKPSAAMQCQKDLARALYERFLENERPAVVIEVSTSDAPGDDQGRTVRVSARAFAPSGEHNEGKSLSQVVERARVTETAARLVTAVLSGEGDPTRIELPRALPKPASRKP